MAGQVRYEDVPERLREVVSRCVEVLGLSLWQINVTMRDHPNDDPTNGAHVHMQYAYERADIQLARAQEPEYQAIHAVHECLHVALAPIDLAIDRIMELVPNGERRRARDLYTVALEQVVSRLSRGIAEAIVPTVDGVG